MTTSALWLSQKNKRTALARADDRGALRPRPASSLLIGRCAVLRNRADIGFDIRHLQRDSIHAMNGVSRVASFFLWSDSGFYTPGQNRALHLNLTAAELIQFVADSFQHVDLGGLVFNQ